MSPEKIRLLALTLITMILSLSVHEFAHAWAATRLGDDTPERDERLTLSPLAHIDPLGTILFPALSVLMGGFPFFGWAKPVQFNPNRFRRTISVRGGSAMVAAAGPLSNLLLAVLSVGLLIALHRVGVLGRGAQGGSSEAISVFLMSMFSTNVALCVFNFLPFPPLDGSYLLPRSFDDLLDKIRPFSLLLLMVLISVPAIRQPLIEWPMDTLRNGILALFGVRLAVASPQTRGGKAHVKPVPPTEPPVEATLDPLAYNVALPQVEFEGPLDLLLHLIQSHQLNILDIPIHFITGKYLEYLSVMQTLSIDVASEYLVMAAVLAHIKSKLLLPVVPDDAKDELEEERLDPRQELVRRLLEYQRFKAAAAEMGSLSEAAQDAFSRPPPPPPPRNAGPLAEFPLHHLVDALIALMGRRKIKINHEVTFERLTITDRINELSDILRRRRNTTFEELFEGVVSKFDIVITFLALLEMSKLRLTRIFQASVYGTLHIEYTLQDASPEDLELSLDFDPEDPS